MYKRFHILGNGMLPSTPCQEGAERLIRPFISANDGSNLNQVMNYSDLYALKFNPDRQCRDERPRHSLGSPQ